MKKSSTDNNSKNTSGKKNASKKAQEISILEVMERIADVAEYSHLSQDFFESMQPMTEALGNILGLTPQQAVFYSLFVNMYDDDEIELGDIREHTKASMIRIAQFQNDIDELEMKRLIRRSESHFKKNTCYHIPMESIDSLRKNKPYVPKAMSNLSTTEFISELDERIGLRYNCGAPYELMFEEVVELINDNMHLKICKLLDEQRKKLAEHTWILLVTMCVCELRHGGSMSVINLKNIFDDHFLGIITTTIERNCHPLMRMGLIDYACSDGMVNKESIVLTRKAKQMFLGEFRKKANTTNSDLLDHKKIAKKSLFFEPEVKQQVDRLSDMLTSPNFREICRRLKASGMRRGFACLFYGAPGTGKTETVMQLAKLTGRKIMQVDFSEIKDKWVGESEKNVKAIFETYRQAVATEKPCPILLFNEADAIIGKRLQSVEHSCDIMNNTMQNIILQEMENFEGILIATTNLENNMDPAFERRFLYKVRFGKPTKEVRKQIWQSIIPSLSDEVALALAKEFEFSGGQIENIARKQIVDNILYGDSADIYAALRQYCTEECLQNRKARPNIGFAA